MWICIDICLPSAEYKDRSLLLECKYLMMENHLHCKIQQCFRIGNVLEI